MAEEKVTEEVKEETAEATEENKETKKEEKTRRYVVIETVNTNDDNALIKTITSFDESGNPQTDGIISFTANELCQMCLRNGGKIDML